MPMRIHPHASKRFLKRGGVEGTLSKELDGRELAYQLPSGKQFCLLPCGMLAVIRDDVVVTVLSKRQAMKKLTQLRSLKPKPKRRPKEFRRMYTED